MRKIAILLFSMLLALSAPFAHAQIVGGGGGGGTTQLLDCSSSLWAALPGSPSVAQCFFVTNAASCVAGTPVTTSGSTGCTLTWTGSGWLPAGNATSAATGGVTSVGMAVPSQFTISGSPITSSGTLALGYTANSLAAHNFGTGISVNGLLTGAQPGAADISAGTFGGAFTFSTAPTMSGANITSATIPDASLVTTPLLPANNLSDVSSAATSRTNLGLGTAATQNTGTSGATLGLLNGNLTFGGTDTFSIGPTMSGANISSTTIPTGSLATVQGNGTKVQLSTGTTTTNDCVKFDANGNTVDNGGACGSGATPGFINTPTVSAGAVTLSDQCTSAGCTDYNRVANGTNTGTLAVTTAAAASMHDGQSVDVEVDMDGTHAPSSITWTGGTGVTLNYGVIGNTASATTCGTPSATGQILAKWQWNSSTGDLTLRGCAPVPAATALSVALGGTSLSTLTSHAVEVGAGTSPITQVGPDSTSGQPLLSAGASADPAFGAVSLSGSGVTGTLPIANGGTNSTTGGLLTTSSTNSNVFGIGFDFIGTPTASMVEATNLAYEISVPANYATPTSSCTCGTNPSETDAYTVKCNGTTQGTFSLNTSCALTLPTNSAYTCSAGQRFELDAPATVSGKDIACTVAYTR